MGRKGKRNKENGREKRKQSFLWARGKRVGERGEEWGKKKFKIYTNTNSL